ncbi:MAG: MarR family winged helix-turn-helix transcriptional regulator [Eubacteriales bacterium]|nr:MarR family winged helix-turn-helix transcriptional regulator [Eubacteriales bacterium]
MDSTKESQNGPFSPEENFKKLTQLHRSRLYRVAMSRGLYIGQPALLLTLKQQGICSQTELAEALNVTTPSIAVSVKRLEKGGMITKTINEKDNRYNQIELTDEGKKSARVCEDIFEAINTKMFNGFSKDELTQVNALFDRMRQNLVQYDPDKEPIKKARGRKAK